MRIARFLPLIALAAFVLFVLVACGKGGGGY
jgi:hypothetical protein